MQKLIPALILIMTALIPPAMAASDEPAAVRRVVSQWKDAWQQKDMTRYLSFYSPQFRHDGKGLNHWADRKRMVFSRSEKVTIDVKGISVMIDGDLAAVQFVQRFSSPSHTDVGEKQLLLSNASGRWMIISESWTPLNFPAYFPKDQRFRKEHAEAPSNENTDTDGRDIPSENGTVGQPVEHPSQGASGGGGVDATGSEETLVHEPLSTSQETGIRYRKTNGWEQVCIRLQHPFVPKVFPIEGERPRLVADIAHVKEWKAPPALPADGKLVQRIRSYLHVPENRLRVVVDLNSAGSYTISQVADPAMNTHCFLIK